MADLRMSENTGLVCPNCGASASLPLGMTCDNHSPTAERRREMSEHLLEIVDEGKDVAPQDAPPEVQDQAAATLYERRGASPWPTCGR